MHGIIAVGTFVEAWINTPWEPIPEPGSSDKDEKKEEDDVPANDEGIINCWKANNSFLRNSFVYVSPLLNTMHLITCDNVHYCIASISK